MNEEDKEWEEYDEDEEDYDSPISPLEFNGELRYYFDLHPTREDLMGKTVEQSHCTSELMANIAGLDQAKNWFVVRNFSVYRTNNPREYPAEPDGAVYKNVIKKNRKDLNLSSWKMVLPNRPAPSVVFEITHPQTWRIDLYEKPFGYKHYGVKEYFAFDPHQPLCWDKPGPLIGWRYHATDVEELKVEANGWMWSIELDSWLVPENGKLRLYDRDGQLRPSNPNWYSE
jgi:Uma2 family endonuclease